MGVACQILFRTVLNNQKFDFYQKSNFWCSLIRFEKRGQLEKSRGEAGGVEDVHHVLTKAKHNQPVALGKAHKTLVYIQIRRFLYRSTTAWNL